MSTTQRDFTKGPIARGMIAFSMPFLLSNILQALYGAVDMYVVGNFSDADPAVCATILSGVTMGSQITHLVAMMVSGLTVSGTVMVGQYVGAKKQQDASETVGTMFTLLGVAGVVMVGQYIGARKPKDASQTVGTMFSLLFIVGAVLTAVMMALSGPILRLLNTPDDAFAHAQSYLNICLSGTLFIFGYNAISSIQRGLGDSIRPLIFVGVACAVNIALDLWLVKGLHMGAAGAAWATVIAQAVSLLLAAWYLSRNRFIFDFRPRSFRIHRDKMNMMVRLGIPSSVQSIIVNISFLVMIALVNIISNNETAPSAAVGVVGKFNSFAILPAVAMSSSVSAFAAQNMGAGKIDRARKSLNVGMILALLISGLVFAAVQMFPEAVIELFNKDPDTIRCGKEYIFTFSFDYLLVPIQFCLNGLVMGAGHTRFTLLSSSLSSLLLRIPVAILFGSVLGWGLSGVGLAGPAATVAGVALTAWFVLSGRWKKNQTGIHAEEEPS